MFKGSWLDFFWGGDFFKMKNYYFFSFYFRGKYNSIISRRCVISCYFHQIHTVNTALLTTRELNNIAIKVYIEQINELTFTNYTERNLI